MRLSIYNIHSQYGNATGVTEMKFGNCASGRKNGSGEQGARIGGETHA